MYETKVNLVMTIPGRVMMSEKECLRKVRKPLLNKKTGKQIVSKNGEPVWHTVLEADPSKTDSNTLTISNGSKEETIYYRTRKAYPAQQRLNICREAFEDFTSTTMPADFIMPKGFKAPTITIKDGKTKPKYPNTSLKNQAWLEMSEKERLEWHLKEIANSLGGIMAYYTIFED